MALMLSKRILCRAWNIAHRRLVTAPDHRYALVLIWKGGEKNTPTVDYKSYTRELQSDIAGKSSLALSADPNFMGDRKLHNPEDLLLMSLSSCHALSYLSLCARNNIVVSDYVDNATAVMSFAKDSYQFKEAVLYPRVTITAGDAERAKRLHADAHHFCFIARSVNFPVLARPEIIVKQL